jgi:hypothetical protein
METPAGNLYFVEDVEQLPISPARGKKSKTQLPLQEERVMTRIAIIDIDGVIANSDARFALARQGGDGQKGAAGSVNWSVAFEPANVVLDTLIQGADQAVQRLERLGYAIIFLTSRPESMRQATEAWLTQREMDGYEVIMKPVSALRVKTVKWKADEVARIASLYIVDEIIFVDDEEANRQAVEALGTGIKIKRGLDDYMDDDAPIII